MQRVYEENEWEKVSKRIVTLHLVMCSCSTIPLGVPESLLRTSALNCAHIYNDGLALHSLSSSLPVAYSKKFVLDVENVWDGVCLYWLLEDVHECDAVLVLVHDAPTQAK